MKKIIVSLALIAAAGISHATDVAKKAIQGEGLAKPNVIFGMDDSGSMDFEVMLPRTSDGTLWWDNTAGIGWSNRGTWLFSGNSKYGYLFPNGCSTSGYRHLCEGNSHFAIAPTPQFAALRSSTYNPLYYDSTKTYEPWAPATVGGVLTTFSAANPRSALSHPLFPATGKDLLTAFVNTSNDHRFFMRAGMVIPAGAVLTAASSSTNVCARNLGPRTLTSALTVEAGRDCYAQFPAYYLPSFWRQEACTVNGSSCVVAPDGRTLRLYEIRTGNTFPSGRTYDAELQNFANWFTYYRKRKLMLAASMGQVLLSLDSMRVGVVAFNNRVTPTMFDMDSTDVLANGKIVAGRFYSNPASGGTPTRETLAYIGAQFASNRSVVQYSCQKNAAFIVTDGFAAANTVTPPSYDANLYGAGSPYAQTFAGTLADIALSYYTNTLRTDLPAGRVPAAAATATDPAADKNPNLHMNTYAITLGAQGNMWPARTNAYGLPALVWENPNENLSPKSIDDLWHATVNGRGKMFLATNPSETAVAIEAALKEILRSAGSQSGFAVSSVNLRASDAFAYAGIYRTQGWSGDIASFPINISTGAVGTTPTWSAAEILANSSPSSRKIASYVSGTGVVFESSAVGSLVNPSNTYGTTADVVAYLRGERSKEGTVFRTRTGVMGAVINAEPVVDLEQNIVFATTNDGMVHAFDRTSGEELWAYVPGFVLSKMGAQTRKDWEFETLLDATPVLAKVNGRKYLIGGAGSGGPGFYAIDVTDSANLTAAQLATRIKWEFPAPTMSANDIAEVGASVGKPVVVNTTRFGSVALITSGYNSSRDGRGRLWGVDVATGTVRFELATPTGGLGTADSGLAAVSGFLEADKTVRYAYGGDEQGNLWRFDLDGLSVSQLASLRSSTGAVIPVTAAPELAYVSGRRMVFVGTGRFLGMTDFNDPLTHSFFGIWDNGQAGTTRASLAVRNLTVNPDGTRSVSGSAVNWASQLGWVLNLPAGEKAHTDPAIAYGAITWSTNKPSITSCGSTSAFYVASLESGLGLGADQLGGTAFYGREIASSIASRVVLSRLPSGTLTITTRQADNTTMTQEVKIKAKSTPKKTGWRQVNR